METFEAVAHREEAWWSVLVPAVDRATQARRLRDVEKAARELVCLVLDRDPDEVGVTVRVVAPPGVQERLDAVVALREQARQANREATALSRATARQLSEMGLTVREVGVVMGMSYQNAADLIRG